jgi:hypothetical protein
MKIVYLSCFLLIVSCKTEDKTQMNITGKWDLTYGEYNGQPAPSLEKIYFTFQKDTLLTNFTATAEEVKSTFKLKNKKLIQQTSEPIIYEIEDFNDSTLKMKTALRGADFLLTLTKAIPVELNHK